MNVIFVTYEQYFVSPGTFNIAYQLFNSKLFTQCNLRFYVNKCHWATKKFKNLLVFPIIFPSELLNIVRFNLIYLNIIITFLRILSNIFYIPVAILIAIYKIYCFKADSIIIHAGNWPGGPLIYTFVMAGILCRVKNIILVLHNSPESRVKLKYSLLEILINKSNVKLVTVSEYTKKEIIKNSFFREISVIYNGFDYSEFISSKKSTNNSKIRLGFVGYISHRKGVDILFDALKKINFSYELHLFGNTDFNYLNNFLQTDNKNIIYHGFCNNLVDIYSSFDVLILPSRYDESFGMVILEAMSFSKPVICSDAGGMQEIVIHGRTGYIFQSESSLQLASYISKFNESYSDINTFGANGYLHLINNFSLNRMITSYYSLIDNHEV